MEIRGPWDEARVTRHLEQATIPVRLAFLTADGTPHVASLWYLHRDGSVWCASQQDAFVVRKLGDDPRCGFEVAADDPPYRGVRGRGRATLHAELGGEVLGELIDRYLGDRSSELARWLLGRSETEVAVQIEPELIVTWDFGERMA